MSSNQDTLLLYVSSQRACLIIKFLPHIIPQFVKILLNTTLLDLDICHSLTIEKESLCKFLVKMVSIYSLSESFFFFLILRKFILTLSAPNPVLFPFSFIEI